MKGNIFVLPDKDNCKIVKKIYTLKILRMLTQVSIISKPIAIKFDIHFVNGLFPHDQGGISIIMKSLPFIVQDHLCIIKEN
jgi:hypothetical protein